MICAHAGSIMCARLTESLWVKFLQRNGKMVPPYDRQKSAENLPVVKEISKSRSSAEPSWHEPSLPPPMPILATTPHLVWIDAQLYLDFLFSCRDSRQRLRR